MLMKRCVSAMMSRAVVMRLAMCLALATASVASQNSTCDKESSACDQTEGHALLQKKVLAQSSVFEARRYWPDDIVFVDGNVLKGLEAFSASGDKITEEEIIRLIDPEHIPVHAHMIPINVSLIPPVCQEDFDSCIANEGPAKILEYLVQGQRLFEEHPFPGIHPYLAKETEVLDPSDEPPLDELIEDPPNLNQVDINPFDYLNQLRRRRARRRSPPDFGSVTDAFAYGAQGMTHDAGSKLNIHRRRQGVPHDVTEVTKKFEKAGTMVGDTAREIYKDIKNHLTDFAAGCKEKVDQFLKDCVDRLLKDAKDRLKQARICGGRTGFPQDAIDNLGNGCYSNVLNSDLAKDIKVIVSEVLGSFDTVANKMREAMTNFITDGAIYEAAFETISSVWNSLSDQIFGGGLGDADRKSYGRKMLQKFAEKWQSHAQAFANQYLSQMSEVGGRMFGDSRRRAGTSSKSGANALKAVETGEQVTPAAKGLGGTCTSDAGCISGFNCRNNQCTASCCVRTSDNVGCGHCGHDCGHCGFNTGKTGSYTCGYCCGSKNWCPENQVTTGGAGGWGGSCTCPDGNVYQVGDAWNACGSLACIGGISGTCNRHDGPWSGRKVVCATPLTSLGQIGNESITDDNERESDIAEASNEVEHTGSTFQKLQQAVKERMTSWAQTNGGINSTLLSKFNGLTWYIAKCGGISGAIFGFGLCIYYPFTLNSGLHTPVFEVSLGYQAEGLVEAEVGVKVGPILTNCAGSLEGSAESAGIDIDVGGTGNPGLGIDFGITWSSPNGPLVSVDLFAGLNVGVNEAVVVTGVDVDAAPFYGSAAAKAGICPFCVGDNEGCE